MSLLVVTHLGARCHSFWARCHSFGASRHSLRASRRHPSLPKPRKRQPSPSDPLHRSGEALPGIPACNPPATTEHQPAASRNQQCEVVTPCPRPSIPEGQSSRRQCYPNPPEPDPIGLHHRSRAKGNEEPAGVGWVSSKAPKRPPPTPSLSLVATPFSSTVQAADNGQDLGANESAGLLELAAAL